MLFKLNNMAGQLIDGKKIAQIISKRTTEKVVGLKKAGKSVKLAVILVGEDKPSQTYVKHKGLASKKVGIDFELHEFKTNISKEDLIKKVKEIQEDPDLTGLIVQLPLPEPLYTTDVLNAINPAIDVDCLTDVNLGKLVMKTNTIVPPTPGAVITILKEIGTDLKGKDVTIMGTGALVGKPLAIMMMNEGASITTINSRTKNVKEKCLQADIIVTGVGKKDLLRGNMVKDGAIVIDTGVDFEDGKMYGDVNVKEVQEKASFVTPTPGGVGPNTVARLLWNTAVCAEKK